MNTQILKGYDGYVLFGAHETGAQALKHLRDNGIEVSCYCDNDPAKWDTQFEGISVMPPQELYEYVMGENALVIICTTNSKHLTAKQLDEMGLPYVYYTKPIFVEITSFCNQSCIFCAYGVIKREKTHLDPVIMREFLSDLSSENSDILYPTIYPHVMGEPLVSSHFFNFMDICKELGYYVCIVTNWTLMDKEIQHRLFTEYPDFDIIFSMQGATEKVYDWRNEKLLTYEQWIDLLFEILECKFKYAHKGLMRICTLYPDIVNDVIIRSESDSNLFVWYDSVDEFRRWKYEFGSRCVEFGKDMQRKYPESYEAIKYAVSPVPNSYNAIKPWTDLDEWIKADGLAQFKFAPNVLIYGKVFGTWATDDLLKELLPDDKYIYIEENWHALTNKCDRVGDVSLLSNGQLVACNIDNEAEYVLADMIRGEKYSDTIVQNRIKKLRDNLSLSSLCRRCKSRALVFETNKSDEVSQEVIHYGIRWHKKHKNEHGEYYRVSYEISSVFAFPRIDASSVELDIASVQSKKQFTLIKILSYNDEDGSFSELMNHTIQINPGKRRVISIPFLFEKKLHRIDFITATECHNGVDDGVALYNINLREN